MSNKLHEKHRWAVIKGKQDKTNRKRLYSYKVKRGNRWRQRMKAAGLKDNPFSNYYYEIEIPHLLVRINRNFFSDYEGD